MIKISIIGAGSTVFSGNVIRDLAINDGLHGAEICLMDVDDRRLQVVKLLAERITQELGWRGTITTTTDRKVALRGADFVINTALDGGQNRAETNRALSEKHGYYRGCRLTQVQQLVFFMDVIHDMEAICPDAWLILSANPVFEGCTLMARESNIKVLGLCHGHLGFRKVAKAMELDVEHVRVKCHGFNHCVWMTDFTYKGKDAYPLLDEWIATKAETYWRETDANTYQSAREVEMSRAAIHQYRMFGLLGIGDTPRFAQWYYNQSQEAKEKWYNSWGGYDSDRTWEEYLRRGYEKVDKMEAAVKDVSKPITDTFPPKQSDEQIVPIISAIVNDCPGVFQVNIPNHGLIPEFPEDLAVEVQGLVDGTGIRGIKPPTLPDKLIHGAMIRMWQRCEWRVRAIQDRDPDWLLQMLLADDRTQNIEQAEGLLKDWLQQPHTENMRNHFKK